MRIGPLYHWSPRERRRSIERVGLVPGRAPGARARHPRRVCLREHDDDPTSFRRMTVEEHAEFISDPAPYVCYGTNPGHAWWTSGRIAGQLGETWDLWVAELGEEDQVDVLSFIGDEMLEVRVWNRIPVSRLWWAGERTVTKLRGRNR